MNQYELCHYGIKGQKWGVRRFQNKDGTLTNAGKRRYDKIKDLLSNHQTNVKNKYKDLGYTDEEAEKAAKRRINSEKAVAAVAAVAIVSVAAYAANKSIRRRIDGVIKSGEILQRIEGVGKPELHDSFYVAKGKHDKKRYAGLLGATRKSQYGKAYIMQLGVEKDVKVASQDKAIKAFKDLYENDSAFKSNVSKFIKMNVHGSNNADRIITKSKLSNRDYRKLYENFNSNIPQLEVRNLGLDKKFYNKLKSQGYGAIQDINDMKFSGYKAKNPLIIFDNAGNNISIKSMNEMTGDLNKKATIEYSKTLVSNYLKKYGTFAVAAFGSNEIVKNQKLTKEANYVNQYLKDHPGTKMSRKEITEMYEREYGVI